MSHRISILAVLLCVMAVLSVGCRREAPEPAVEPTGPGPVAQTEPKYNIALIPKGTAHTFWESVHAGGDAAGEELGAEISWNGPAVETDIEGQKRIVENFITSDVDALVLAACDASALIPTLKEARDKGIPVVTIDSGIADDELPVTFVATDNVAGAEVAARHLAELVGDEGEVGCIPFIKGALSSDQREQGFCQEIAKHPNITLLPLLYSSSDVEKGQQVVENMLAANPNIKGIFAANEPAGVAAARVLEERGLAGKVRLVSFDASDAEIAALERGSIQALVAQNPFRMGYDGVTAAVKAIEGEPVEKRIDTGVTIITTENLNSPEVRKVLYSAQKESEAPSEDDEQ